MADKSSGFNPFSFGSKKGNNEGITFGVYPPFPEAGERKSGGSTLREEGAKPEKKKKETSPPAAASTGEKKGRGRPRKDGAPKQTKEVRRQAAIDADPDGLPIPVEPALRQRLRRDKADLKELRDTNEGACLAEDEVRSVQVSFSVSLKEDAVIRQLAQNDGLSVSQYLRKVVFDIAKVSPRPHPERPLPMYEKKSRRWTKGHHTSTATRVRGAILTLEKHGLLSDKAKEKLPFVGKGKAPSE